MRPLIGVTSELGRNSTGQPRASLNAAYSIALTQAGAAPVVIPSDIEPDAAASLVQRLDGILFSGGGDIEPWRYKGNPGTPLIEVSPARDALELMLVDLAVESGTPFLGICRGCQVVNVAFGGSLYEDLDTEPASGIQHNVPGAESPIPVHNVRLESDTLIGQLINRLTLEVNSHHHQGVRVIGDGLRASGHAPDGLVEALELPGHPFGLAVQWHPERLTHEESSRRLFGAFVSAASRAG